MKSVYICFGLFYHLIIFKVTTGYGFGSKRTQCFFADLDLDWIYSVTLVWRPVGNSIRRHRVKNVIIIYHKLWTAKQYHMQSPICNIKLHTEYRMLYTLHHNYTVKQGGKDDKVYLDMQKMVVSVKVLSAGVLCVCSQILHQIFIRTANISHFSPPPSRDLFTRPHTKILVFIQATFTAFTLGQAGSMV